MPKETQAELFIRLLVAEFETDQLIKTFILSRRSPAQAERTGNLCKSDLRLAPDSMEPLDCLQIMSTTLQRRAD